MDHVIFPRFWAEEPALWFAQVEAVFALNNITTDTDKYDYILCELPSSVISLIKDIILDKANSNERDKYKNIKEELIKRISISELKKQEIGSRKPSEFLKYLKQKADPLVPEATVREVWLKGLPSHIKCIVSEMKGDMDTLCHLADTVKDFIPTPDHTWIVNKDQELEKMPAGSVSRIFEQLTAQLESIQSELQMIKFACNEKKRSLCEKCQAIEEKSVNNSVHNSTTSVHNSTASVPNSCSSDQNSNASVNNGPLKNAEVKDASKTCWYHTIYAEKAHHCISPCNFKEKRATQDTIDNTSF